MSQPRPSDRAPSWSDGKSFLPDLGEFTEAENEELRQLADSFYERVERPEDLEMLAKVLHSEDPMAVACAEQALWSAWFGEAGPDATTALHEAMKHLSDGLGTDARRVLDEVIEVHPTFAEAYHQRGMAHTLCNCHCRALEDFLRTVELNPHHFAAMANLGHCCVQLCRYEAAREWYLAALRVHPRVEGVRQMLRRLSKFRDHDTPTV